MTDEVENAVICFERWSKTRVVFYHNDIRLEALFPVNRCMHRDPYCQNVKACGHESACQQFDRFYLLTNAWKFRNGGVKLCPGGVWEWIHSVYWQDDLLGMIIAGARRADVALARKFPVYESRGLRWDLAFSPDEHPLCEVDAANGEDEFVMEGMRQLAARLQELGHRQCENNFGLNQLALPDRLRLLLDRVYRNEEFSIDWLANYFHLSVSRMQHLIKETTGSSFQILVNELRLNEARNLLEKSSLQIRQISDYCNFSTPAYFFRLFKARFGVTPKEYRMTFRRKRQD